MEKLRGRHFFILALSIIFVSTNYAFAQSTSNNIGTLNMEHNVFYQGDSDLIKIFGEVNEYQKGKKITIVITNPDGEIDGSQVFPTDVGYYETYHSVKSDAELGFYKITATYAADTIGEMYFEIQSKAAKAEKEAAETAEREAREADERAKEAAEKAEKEAREADEKAKEAAERAAIEAAKPKPILSFVDHSKGPTHYVERYTNEQEYQKWFDSQFPNYTIWEGIGISEQQYRKIVNDLNRVGQESKTQTSGSADSETYSPYTTSPEDLRNQMGFEAPETYEQGLSQMYATIQYARDTGQLDQMGNWAREANERQRIADLERWENLSFFEKHYSSIILGSLFAAIVAIITVVSILVKRRKKHSGPELPHVEYGKQARASERTNLLLSCRKCNSPLHEDEKFCGKCGNYTVPKPTIKSEPACQSCGTPLKPNEKFCGKCGGKINQF